MNFWVVPLVLVGLLVTGAIALEAWLKRGRHRPFSGQQPDRSDAQKALGLEATDTDGFNRAMRKNAGLATVTGAQKGSWLRFHEASDPDPFDDAGYAETYHRKFGPKRDGNRD
ncbi:hypothetical protein [Actibacterium ureilyticum]|uniref:hypothetical protein n=1 Tax=Actibacterium ureilyticum TaxID=1590614 RepID=UPI000BAAD8A7|nr:hypothetical protein [Actibacterium ureilyticum]